ncbi:hypothetical protein K1X12_06370 [Hyphomonas sp. WL0036]|uniref:hypothetical protein n=1 Tax=Hyphomonas sediminis TaxID=2866160 RepID=UPI001C80AF75|nr:hypothetical protein [Hyphomonas sediminis]MBY9066515.1 hypothetical protein [Hyphomonas sediminis]
MGRKGAAASGGNTSSFLKVWSYGATYIFAGLMLAATGAFLLAAPFLPEVNAEAVRADWLALACLITGLFTANMARMLQVWEKLKLAIERPASRRNRHERNVAHRGLRELFFYTFSAFGGLTAFTFLSAQPHLLPWENLGLHGVGLVDAKPWHVATLISSLSLALVPILTAIYLQAKSEEKTHSRKVLRDDAISVPSFWASAIILGSIVALAGWAASVSGNESATLASNLTFFVTLGVIALFVAFIFLPHLARYLERAGDKDTRVGKTIENGFNPLVLPAQTASYLDSMLVRLIAPLTGATQKGRGIPHSFVLLSIIPLTALGFVLAPPYGLIPIALGMLMVMALGRRWAWIEEDRETASRLLKTESPQIQVGFDNDLKDEALLGYASLFMLVPLALHQIYGWQTTAFEITDASRAANPFFAWISFFGAELAKAVPFVDWWEIYQVDLSPPIEAASDNPLGKHLTFAARAMVDLVIMAALFQAIAIWQRARAQKKLYQIGHVNHFEPFAEREFFESAFIGAGDKPRPEFLKQIQTHIAAREVLRLPGEPYNPERLADLLNSDSPAVRRTALWMVEEYKLLTGTPVEQIRQLRQQWLNLSFPQLSGSRVPSLRKRLLEEKHKFEQLLAELMENPAVVRLEETGLLLSLIEDIRQIPELSFAQIETLRLFGMLRNEYALLALAAHVLPPAETEWRQRVQNKFGRSPTLNLGQAPMRIKVYEALETFGTNPPATPGIQRKTLGLLRLMSQIDGAEPARVRAGKAADAVEDAIRKAYPQVRDPEADGDGDEPEFEPT